MRCCIDALSVIRELNSRSSGLKKYNVYEKAITRQRRELEKVNHKFSELYGDYSEHLINESEYLTLKQQYLLKSEALKKEIDKSFHLFKDIPFCIFAVRHTKEVASGKSCRWIMAHLPQKQQAYRLISGWQDLQAYHLIPPGLRQEA